MSQFNTIGHKTGVVILLDALGTKGIWKRESPENYINRWIQIRAYLQDLQKEKSMIIIEDHLFSDTIIITIVSKENECNHLQLLNFASLVSKYILSTGLKQNLLFRGVISLGDFYTHKEIIIGEAIDNAAKYYEQPQWIGISLTPETALWYNQPIIQNLVRKFPPTDFVEYGLTYNRLNEETNCKEIIVENSFAVNLLHQMYVVNYKLEQVINQLNELKKKAPPKAKSKYSRTIEFILFCESLKSNFTDLYRMK